MRNITRTISMAMLATAICLGGCKKDEAEAPAAPTGGGGGSSAPVSTTPTFTDADGVLIAVNTFTSYDAGGFPVEIQMGTAVGIFPSAGNASVYLDGGTVSLEGTALTKNANNSYVAIPGQTNPMGIDLSGSTHWVVSGNGEVPAIDRSPSFNFPNVGNITSATTIPRNQAYILNVSSVNNADSVVFMVGDIVKTKAPGTISCSFSAAELGTQSAGATVIQVSPYKFQNETISGKKIYFGKQTSRTLSATFQ